MLISCSESKEKSIVFEKIKFDDTPVSLKDSIEFKFIPLETTNECLIGFAESVQIVDDRIFLLEGRQKEKLFVFDVNGKFITSIGRKGQGPGGYNMIFSFDIDPEERSIIISDRYTEKLLFYDLDSYQFKYSLNTEFYYNTFLHLPYGKKIFFGYKGFHNPQNKKDKDSYYVYTTDSLLNPTDVFYKADFKTSYSLTGGKSNLYSYDGKIYIYHHLFPYIYKLENGHIHTSYKIELENYTFPTIDFLKKNSFGDKDYTSSLIKSKYITNYKINECSTMINLSFQKNNELYYGIYNKQSKKGYIFNLPEYQSTMGLGVWVKPGSATDEYIIGQINVEENTYKYTKGNSRLDSIVANKSIEDNPILCLFKIK